MKITELKLQGVKVLEPKVFEDYRGYYMETYSARTLKELGIQTVFVQDNHSKTIKAGTIRGIHFQNNPKAQIKLVRCTKGSILDVAVDLRINSPTFKKWTAVELTEQNKKQIWIPAGFGHGFITLVDNCEVLYKVNEFYDADLDRSIAWNDSEIAVEWGEVHPIISQKDINAPMLKDSDFNFTMALN